MFKLNFRVNLLKQSVGDLFTAAPGLFNGRGLHPSARGGVSGGVSGLIMG